MPNQFFSEWQNWKKNIKLKKKQKNYLSQSTKQATRVMKLR
jgi:hypothetical protein